MLFSALLVASFALNVQAGMITVPETCVSSGDCPAVMAGYLDACETFMMANDATAGAECKKLCDPANRDMVTKCIACIVAADPAAAAMISMGSDLICAPDGDATGPPKDDAAASGDNSSDAAPSATETPADASSAAAGAESSAAGEASSAAGGATATPVAGGSSSVAHAGSSVSRSAASGASKALSSSASVLPTASKNATAVDTKAGGSATRSSIAPVVLLGALGALVL